jgi:hypothetical protein
VTHPAYGIEALAIRKMEFYPTSESHSGGCWVYDYDTPAAVRDPHSMLPQQHRTFVPMLRHSYMLREYVSIDASTGVAVSARGRVVVLYTGSPALAGYATLRDTAPVTAALPLCLLRHECGLHPQDAIEPLTYTHHGHQLIPGVRDMIKSYHPRAPLQALVNQALDVLARGYLGYV